MNQLIVVILSCQLLFYNSSNDISCYNIKIGVKNVVQNIGTDVIFNGNFRFVSLGTNEEMYDVYILYVYKKGIVPYNVVMEETKQRIIKIHDDIVAAIGISGVSVDKYEIIGYDTKGEK